MTCHFQDAVQCGAEQAVHCRWVWVWVWGMCVCRAGRVGEGGGVATEQSEAEDMRISFLALSTLCTCRNGILLLHGGLFRRPKHGLDVGFPEPFRQACGASMRGTEGRAAAQAFAAQLAAQPTPILQLENIVKAHVLINPAEITEVPPIPHAPLRVRAVCRALFTVHPVFAAFCRCKPISIRLVHPQTMLCESPCPVGRTVTFFCEDDHSQIISFSLSQVLQLEKYKTRSRT